MEDFLIGLIQYEWQTDYFLLVRGRTKEVLGTSPYMYFKLEQLWVACGVYDRIMPVCLHFV